MLRPASWATAAVTASRPGKPAVLTISGLAESRWPVCSTSLVARQVPSSSKRTKPVGLARILTANKETPSRTAKRDSLRARRGSAEQAESDRRVDRPPARPRTGAAPRSCSSRAALLPKATITRPPAATSARTGAAPSDSASRWDCFGAKPRAAAGPPWRQGATRRRRASSGASARAPEPKNHTVVGPSAPSSCAITGPVPEIAEAANCACQSWFAVEAEAPPLDRLAPRV